MMQGVLHQFPSTTVEYTFKCRNKAKWSQKIVDRIEYELSYFCTLKFLQKELDYLKSISFFKKDFIDFLSLYKPNCEHINVRLEGKELQITVEGSWLLTIMFEVPILAIVNEVYFENEYPSEGVKRLSTKLRMIRNIEDFKFADFGTRRRYNKEWQRMVVETAVVNIPENFIGTSNVMFANRFNVKPIGTMAHEWIQAGQGIGVKVIDSQRRMLQAWVDEYRGDLGIALTDTLGVDAFIKDFDKYFAKLYDGVRHDSGDPIEWGEKMIAHYQSMGIDSRTKSFVFSDGLTFPKAVEVLDHFRDRANVVFGIGTNFTNDFADIIPLQIVMKMTKCNGRPVAKISDSPGKRMLLKGQDKYITYLKEVFEIQE
jgi:nicotinate phosphoribosyltransferase